MIKTLSKIYQFSGKMQGTMKKAILFSVLHSLFDMMSFGALAMVFSGLTDGFTTSMIWMIFGITLASMLLKIYCSYISDFGKVQIGYFMCAEKRIHIGDRMKYMPMGYFNDHNLGNLTSVVTTTMGDIENNASMVLTNILGGYIHAAIITIVMLCIDWRIGLTILCGILLFTWCIGRLQKKSETVSPQRQQAQEALVSNVLEYVQGMLIVKSFNLGQNSNSKMRQAILDSKDKNLKLERTFVPYNMLQQIILYGTSILVIVEGLYFYLNGTMALSICLLMTVASFMLFSQLQSAGNTSSLLRLLDVSIDKVNEIDKTPVMDEHGKPVKPENYNIVFDDVSFSYGEHQVLDHVSLTIPERTVTAIVGPSGAGKSTALKMLEDMGYFCVDNLPVPLIPKFAELLAVPGTEMNKAALGVDIRSGQSFQELANVLKVLDEGGCQYEILYLESSDDVLVKRYKETRRFHPLAGSDGRVEDGLKRERELLGFLKKKADYLVDTSHMLTRELKAELNKIFVQNKEYKNLYITVLSFGFKYGIPNDADLVFDVRFLPNPYYIEELRPMSGNDQPVRDYVMNNDTAKQFLTKLTDMVEFLIPNYISEGKTQLVIGIGCTGGKHRSVTLANELYEALKKTDSYGVRIEHRDIGKDAITKAK